MTDTETKAPREKLSDFLESNGIAKRKAASTIGVSHVTLMAWLDGRLTPSQPFRDGIEVWTNGAITAAEWTTAKERERAAKASGVMPFVRDADITAEHEAVESSDSLTGTDP